MPPTKLHNLVVLLGLLGPWALATVDAPDARASEPCAWDGVVFPAQAMKARPSLLAAAKALGLAATTEDDAARVLGVDATHGAGVVLTATGVVVIVARPAHGGFWQVGPLAGLAPPTATPTINASDPMAVVVDLGAPAGPDAQDRHLVIVRASGRIAALHAAPHDAATATPAAAPAVQLAQGQLTIGGPLPLHAALTALDTCASANGLASPKAGQRWLERGQKATRAHQYETAIAAFGSAIVNDPSLAKAHSGLGYALLLQGQSPAARIVPPFMDALARDPSPGFQAAVWYNIGLAHEADASNATDNGAEQASMEAAQAAFETSVAREANVPRRAALARVEAWRDAFRFEGGRPLTTGCGQPDLSGGAAQQATFPTFAAFAAARHLDAASWEALCKTTEACHGDLLIWRPNGPDDEVVTRGPSGAIVTYGIFPAQAGSGCPWSPRYTFDRIGPWLLIEQTGDMCVFEDFDNFSFPGPSYVGAVFDTRTMANVLVAECGGTASLQVAADGTLTWSPCVGPEVKGALAQLSACP